MKKKPRIRFARNFGAHLYLADMSNFCILVTNNRGNVLQVVGQGQGQHPSQFAQPAGITSDSDGNIVVAGNFIHCRSIYVSFFERTEK